MPIDPYEDLTIAQLAQRRFNDARDHSSTWRQEARECFGFYAGTEQWSQWEKEFLEDQGRPALSFNRAGTIIEVVSGSEVNNRQEIRYLPRSTEDGGQNEVLTSAAKYFRENCDAEDEETEAFHDMLVCGMGWCETRIDYEMDFDGQLVIERIDPLEMFWDPTANKANLANARWIMRVRTMSRAEFNDNWPDKIDEVIDNARAFSTFETEPTVQSRTDYDQRLAGIGYDPESGMITVAQYQWFEKEATVRVVNPQTGQIEHIKPGKFNKIQAFLEDANLPFVRTKRRVYKQAFIAGNVELESGNAPSQSGFTLTCMTGKRDRNAGTFFGLVRPMIDPQRWANKWLSQILHILNTNPKGGVIVEATAVDDQEDFEDRYSASDSVMWVNEGGIGKVIPKPQSAMPEGLQRLTDFAVNSMPYVTGVNFELLGLSDREQAGVLEYQRKQSGMTVLATLFNSLRRYRKQQGRIMLELITKYVSDGRMIRIVGEEGAKYVPLLKKQIGTYDTIVDDAPTSMNVKDMVWTIFTQAAPFLAKMGIPIPPDVLDYVPLPATLVEKWKQYLQQRSQQPGPEANPADLAKAQNIQQQTQLDAMDMAMKQQAHQQDLAMKDKQMQTDAAIAAMKVNEQAMRTQGMAATAQAQFAKARAESVRATVVPIDAARAAQHENELHKAKLAKLRRQ